MSEIRRRAAAVALALTVFGSAGAATGQLSGFEPTLHENGYEEQPAALLPRPAPLWDWRDATLQAQLEAALRGLGLAPHIRSRILGVTLVDITDPYWPRVAAVNGDRMYYAASLPKIAVMLAVFQQVEDGRLALNRSVRTQLRRMIRRSSNPDATALMHIVGKPYIARVLASPRYRLYDPRYNGGLWVGKDYAKASVWKRDPLAHLSHGATAMQVARFFYLLERGELVSAGASKEMKELLSQTDIDHKFVKGLRSIRPQARIYRKSGTWEHHHADAALIERSDGAAYIAVALMDDSHGAEWLPRIIVQLDSLIESNGAVPARVRR